MADINNKKCLKKLNNGIKIPCLGLGVYLINNTDSIKVFNEAIEIGYRLFDTATLYGNEKEVGEAIRMSGVAREEFFVTTKLWNSDQRGKSIVIKAFNRSFNLLNLDYIDLYLIHWPVPKERITSWKTLESLLATEKVKSIGVSNYMIHHLEELLGESSVIPTINQIELHPFHFRKDLIDFCAKHKIQVQAYSPLTKAKLLNEPQLNEIAIKYNKSPAQILIRWNLQHGTVVIPKASKEKHLKENFDVFNFQISPLDMKKLDSLNKRAIVSWDPTNLS
ncbi:MAG: aldo/keto reductase [Candidatus Hodarchaeota archaeon]